MQPRKEAKPDYGTCLVQGRGELCHAPRHLAPLLARGHDEHPAYHRGEPGPLQAPRLVRPLLGDHLKTQQQPPNDQTNAKILVLLWLELVVLGFCCSSWGSFIGCDVCRRLDAMFLALAIYFYLILLGLGYIFCRRFG